MTCCSHCHADLTDGRCVGCRRTPSWCRCRPVAVEPQPVWLTRSRERRNGLARDLSGVR